MSIRFLFLIALLGTGQACLAQQSYAKQVKEFDNYIESARKAWGAPGLAVTVVKNGEVLLKKGYGVTELGTAKEVNSATLFACASTTKAMTATCMGMLVDEGKVQWTDRVIEYLPEFQLYDPFVTRELRILDLFTHNSGVGNADFLWTIMEVNSDEVLKKMRMVEPSYSLRSSFIYQNIFYLAAGKVIEKVSGQPWNEFIQERIFNPLKMTRTFPTLKQIQDSNQTKPHFEVDGKTIVIENTSADQIGPAGSVWSCVDDMSKWVMCMIDSGKYDGGRLVKPSTWTMMTKPHVMVTESQFYPTQKLTKPNWTTYGLGWFQHDYKGRKVNFHTGSLAGAIAIHGQLPEEKLGIYVFGNFDHAEVRHALMYKAFDLFALGGTRDWSAEFLKLYTNLRESDKKRTQEFKAKRVENTKPSLQLTQYEGEYSDPLYGSLVVRVKENELDVNINEVVHATLNHWHYDSFYGPYNKSWYGNALVQFELSATGQVKKINFDGLEFTRKQD